MLLDEKRVNDLIAQKSGAMATFKSPSQGLEGLL